MFSTKYIKLIWAVLKVLTTRYNFDMGQPQVIEDVIYILKVKQQKKMGFRDSMIPNTTSEVMMSKQQLFSPLRVSQAMEDVGLGMNDGKQEV